MARLVAAIIMLGLAAAVIGAVFIGVTRLLAPSQPQTVVQVVVTATSVPAQAAALPTSSVVQQPAATPTPTPTVPPVPSATPTPQATATPTPKAGDVLYQADWTKSASGFAGTGWTYLSGMFVSDGSSAGTRQFLTASYQPPSIDYALEAEIQLVVNGNQSVCGVGIIARDEQSGGIRGGIGCPADAKYKPSLVIQTDSVDGGIGLSNYGPVALQPYQLDTSWHTYRLEVKGNTITLFVDGQQRLQATDNTRLKNGKIGIVGYWPCSVRSFKVIAV